MSTVTTSLMTAEEFWEWTQRPENQGKWWELERGEVVEMPPPGELHGVICFLIARLLGNYVFDRGSGYVCTNDTGILLERDPDTVRGPEVMLFDERRRLADLSPKISEGIPKLVVEVLSPTDRPNQTIMRLRQYLDRGIPLVWLVDPESRTVTVHRPGQLPDLVKGDGELIGGEVLPGLRLRAADLFTLPGEQVEKPKP